MALHLIPNILAENSIQVIPAYIKDVISPIRIFFVEEIRSARRLLRALDKNFDIDACQFIMLNEHQALNSKEAIELLTGELPIGLISEAGCPSVADPGKELVALAHQLNIAVIPHVGPNSILLALMASGFNGQQFQFLGYLPNKQPFLSQKIKEIESESRVKNCTQLFIETPYRNDQLIQEILQHCHADTKLCVAANLTAEN
ncbi:MAG: SAM-dependent methyltransferase, partial [Chitinophagaceae bacterium]|nr:SAM-dependent methyltransferase [Chitinophagaceae bacterium]